MFDFQYKFTPSLWPSLGFVIVLPLFIALGNWQLGRADEKQQLKDDYTNKQQTPALSLNEIVKDARRYPPTEWSKVQLNGRFLADKTVLLDNKIRNGQAGYYVFVPFVLEASDKAVFVNLGWLAGGPDRRRIPDLKSVAAIDTLTGVVKQPQYSGIQWQAAAIESVDNVARAQTMDYQQLAEFFNTEFEPYIVRVLPGSESGYDTDWPEPGFGKEKHYGYAFQWFAFAAVLVVLYVCLNVKRKAIES